MPKGVYKRKPFSEKHRENICKSHKGKPKPWLKGKPSGSKGKNWKHTKQARQKIKKNNAKYWLGKERLKMRGKKNPSWAGGISFEPYSVDWTVTLKRAIRERDNYICQICSKYGNIVHHIDYDKKNCDPKNLITLCRGCHAKTNFNRKHWQNFLKEMMK